MHCVSRIWLHLQPLPGAEAKIIPPFPPPEGPLVYIGLPVFPSLLFAKRSLHLPVSRKPSQITHHQKRELAPSKQRLQKSPPLPQTQSIAAFSTPR